MGIPLAACIPSPHAPFERDVTLLFITLGCYRASTVVGSCCYYKVSSLNTTVILMVLMIHLSSELGEKSDVT